MNAVFAGFDLGGTKTDVLVRTGTTSRSLRLGGGNLRLDDPDVWARRIAGVFLETNPNALPVYVCVGAAGGGSPAAAHALQEAITRRLPILKGVRVVSDTRIAWEAAFSSQPGVIVIAGTGSGCFTVDGQGREHRTGGWGPDLGDPGSGRSIGASGIRFTLAAVENASYSLVAQRILDVLVPGAASIGDNATSASRVLDAVYAPGFTAASLAGVVIQACEDGCPDARDLLLAEAATLASQCQRLVAHHPPASSRIALVGGLTRLPAYALILEAALHTVLPDYSLQEPEHQPVMGALRIAEGLAE